jgi:plastocyanin
MAEIKIVPGQGRAAFSPDPVAIAKNTRVFWLNDDNQNHQISLTGEVLKPGETSSEVVLRRRRTSAGATSRSRSIIRRQHVPIPQGPGHAVRRRLNTDSDPA